MARPRKATEERRDQLLHVRLTTAERAELDRTAHALGLTTAEFLRRRSLGYRLPPAHGEQQATAALATALLRIGVNLNQHTHHVNAGRAPHAAKLADLINRINAMLDGIYDPGTD
ncbi:hypothetical protein [Methylobacterium sp. GC_Met_2]|uniref:plasmid mobilization protein n=1 Tax=Methylobacterium sp. GC_Met_2 TaxID=2937376 RepID=UPI00226B07FE|nr:hypothetical protein [Methylobacterium sp. GC_Met_2]